MTKSQRVTDASGTVVSTVELDPWGGDTNRSSNGAFQPKKYTSYVRDANGSDEAMYRRYSRWQSRFDQPDPYDGSYDQINPQSFNRYAYTQNDPVSSVDPTGLMPTICGYIHNNGEGGYWTCVELWDPYHWGGLGPGGGKGTGPKPPQNTDSKDKGHACPPVPEAPGGVSIDENIGIARKNFLAAQTPSFSDPYGSGFDFIASLEGHYLWFKRMVQDRGDWDYKYRDPAVNEGKRSKYEAFGNFNYGATGAAAGFSPDQLFRLAGHYQTDKSNAEGVDPGLFKAILGIGGRPPYGDELADYEQVRRGIEYYKGKFVRKDCY